MAFPRNIVHTYCEQDMHYDLGGVTAKLCQLHR